MLSSRAGVFIGNVANFYDFSMCVGLWFLDFYVFLLRRGIGRPGCSCLRGSIRDVRFLGAKFVQGRFRWSVSSTPQAHWRDHRQQSLRDTPSIAAILGEEKPLGQQLLIAIRLCYVWLLVGLTRSIFACLVIGSLSVQLPALIQSV